MNSEETRELLAKELDCVISGPSQSFYSVWDREPAPDAGIFLPEFPHFEAVLSGELPLILPSGGGARCVRVLRAGEALHLSPGYGCWRRMDTNRELLVVNFHRDGIECYISRHEFKNGAEKSVRSSYHSSAPIETGGMNLLKAFSFYSKAKRGEMLMPIFRLLLAAVKANLLNDMTGTEERTLLTYRMLVGHMREKCCTPISRKTVASEFGLSPDYLSHLFKKFGSEGFHASLERMRMEKAELCLKQRSLGIAQISKLCGFERPSYFIRVFRNRYGMTPGEFRSRGELR